jgi:hypothetical protein
MFTLSKYFLDQNEVCQINGCVCKNHKWIIQDASLRKAIDNQKNIGNFWPKLRNAISIYVKNYEKPIKDPRLQDIVAYFVLYGNEIFIQDEKLLICGLYNELQTINSQISTTNTRALLTIQHILTLHQIQCDKYAPIINQIIYNINHKIFFEMSKDCLISMNIICDDCFHIDVVRIFFLYLSYINNQNINSQRLSNTEIGQISIDLAINFYKICMHTYDENGLQIVFMDDLLNRKSLEIKNEIQKIFYDLIWNISMNLFHISKKFPNGISVYDVSTNCYEIESNFRKDILSLKNKYLADLNELERIKQQKILNLIIYIVWNNFISSFIPVSLHQMGLNNHRQNLYNKIKYLIHNNHELNIQINQMIQMDNTPQNQKILIEQQEKISKMLDQQVSIPKSPNLYPDFTQQLQYNITEDERISMISSRITQQRRQMEEIMIQIEQERQRREAEERRQREEAILQREREELERRQREEAILQREREELERQQLAAEADRIRQEEIKKREIEERLEGLRFARDAELGLQELERNNQVSSVEIDNSSINNNNSKKNATKIDTIFILKIIYLMLMIGYLINKYCF